MGGGRGHGRGRGTTRARGRPRGRPRGRATGRARGHVRGRPRGTGGYAVDRRNTNARVIDDRSGADGDGNGPTDDGDSRDGGNDRAVAGKLAK